MKKLPQHWSKDTVKGFWWCFWYDIFCIIFGFLMFAGSVVASFFVGNDYIPCCISIAGSGGFLMIIGVALLIYLLDF